MSVAVYSGGSPGKEWKDICKHKLVGFAKVVQVGGGCLAAVLLFGGDVALLATLG